MSEERLARDAADVHARAAERLVALHAHDALPELRGADRGDIAARPAADDEHVTTLFGHRTTRPASRRGPPSAPSRALGTAPRAAPRRCGDRTKARGTSSAGSPPGHPRQRDDPGSCAGRGFPTAG